ncbi:MAG: hypothetical protein ACOYN0_06915 [Phycisphaerales bacterium]
MRCFIMGCSALAIAAGSSHAALFSFASDRNQDGPTFSALAVNAISDGRSLDANGVISVDFLADRDNDGPGAAQSVEAQFEFAANITSYQVVAFGGQFIHNFTISGAFNIVQPGAQPTVIFHAMFNNALFSSFSNSANQLGRSAQIQANDQADPSLMFATGGVLADIDVSDQRDFAFSLSNVQLANGNRVPVSANGITAVPWSAEGSFSASAIPAPGVLALGGLGLIATARRRRA